MAPLDQDHLLDIVGTGQKYRHLKMAMHYSMCNIVKLKDMIKVYLYLFFYQLFRMVNLLWGASNGKYFKIGITIWWWLIGYFHKRPSLLVN